MTSTSVSVGDPREVALTRARALYPAATVAEQIAVAEFLLREVPAAIAPLTPPARYYPDGWHYPLKITCSTLPPAGEFITTNRDVLARSG